MVSAHNYVCNFDFVPCIWSRLHDKDCLYILSSSKNSLSLILTSRDNTLSFSFTFSLTESTHSLHSDLQRQHILSPIFFTYRDSTLSLILSILTYRVSTHSQSLHCNLQRQHILSLSYILTSSSQPHKNVYILQPFSFLFCLFS